MNRINKICALIVIFTISLGMFALQPIFAAVEPNEFDEPDNKSFELAIALGVFEGIETANPSDYMTGADFIKALENVTGSSIAGEIYLDIAASNEVSCIEAVRVFVDILGYTIRAKIDGGYPVGYLAQALKLKIINNDDIIMGQAVSFGFFAKLLENSLEVDLLRQIAYGTDVTYGVIKGKNFISEIMEMGKVECVQMTGNNVTGMGYTDGVGKNLIEVGGATYRIDDSQAHLNRYIGRYVDLYYIRGKNDTPPYNVKYMALSDRYHSVTIDAEDIIEYNDYVLKYFDSNDRIRSIKININGFVVCNGVQITSFLREDFNLENGSVIFQSGPSGYDAAIITKYEDYVVGNKFEGNLPVNGGQSQYQRVIFDKLDISRTLNFDQNNEIDFTITDINGSSVTYEDLKENDILSVARSYDGRYMDVIVSAASVNNALITEINQEGSTKRISFADRSLLITERFFNSERYFDLAINKNYNIFVNAFNQVAFVTSVAAPTTSMGYLVKMILENSLSGGLKVRIFSSDGQMLDFSTAKKIQIGLVDGNSVTYSYEEAYAFLKDINEVVWYSLNGDGLITELNLPLSNHNPDNPDRYHKIGSGELSYNYSFHTSMITDTINPSMIISPNCVVFDIPADIENYDDYRTGNRDDYFNDGARDEFTASIYSYDSHSLWAHVLALRAEPRRLGITTRDQLAIVTRVTKRMNTKGTLVTRIVGMKAGARIVLDSPNGTAFENAYSPVEGPSKTYSIIPGDVIRYRISQITGYAEEVHLIWRADMENPAFPHGARGHLVGTTGNYVGGDNGNPYGTDRNYQLVGNAKNATKAPFRVFYGWVYKKKSGIAVITTQDLSIQEYDPNAEGHITEYLNVGAMAGIIGRYTTVDFTNRDEITAKSGAYDDLRSYEEVGASCSRVITVQYYMEPRSMMIINGDKL